jgi:hypothetical protein
MMFSRHMHNPPDTTTTHHSTSWQRFKGVPQAAARVRMLSAGGAS